MNKTYNNISNKNFNYLCFFILVSTLFFSCDRDCEITIHGIKDTYGITKDKTANLAFDNWYKTDSFNNDFHLYVDLDVSGAGEYCKYYMVNKIIDDSIRIYSNRKFIANNDSIPEFSNIIRFINITKDVHQTYLDVGYFIDLNKLNNSYSFAKGEYTVITTEDLWK